MSKKIERILEDTLTKQSDNSKRISDLEAGEYNHVNKLYITDGITAPSAETNWAQLYVDTADGKLTVKYDDNTTAHLDTQDTTYTAGLGLSLSGATFDVDFAGGGAATTVSRSDHDHNSDYAAADHTHDVGARVYRSSNQSINNTTFTAITFNSERYDTDNIHSTVSNTSRLTCQTAGKYIIVGQVKIDNNVTGYRICRIVLGGSTVLSVARELNPTTASAANLIVTTIYDLATSNYVELEVWQNSGGSLNVLSDSNSSPEFMMHLLE